jgi:hypothetical protein
MMTTNEIAASLGVPRWAVTYRLRTGELRPPRKLGSGDLYWTDDDLPRVREAVARHRPHQKKQARSS